MMDLDAIAGQERDASHNSAAAAAARMRGPDGFLICRLDAAAAATVQVGSWQQRLHDPPPRRCNKQAAPVQESRVCRCNDNMCTGQAALALAAPALDAHLRQHPTVGKVLVKVQPRSALRPAPPAFDKV